MTVVRETTNSTPGYWSKMSASLTRQVRQIRAGDWQVFWQKIIMILSFLPALPIVLFIRLLRPFIVIRIGRLISERIGHFAANTEVCLCERDAGMNVPYQRYMDIFYHSPSISNAQLRTMWDRTLNIWPFAVVAPVDRLSRLLPAKEAHIIPCDACQRDVHNVLERFPPHLFFLPDEEIRGQANLRAMGIPEGVPFICFHARDLLYLETIYPAANYHYHDYRDSVIHNYILAAEKLTLRGYYAIRMGAMVKEALNVSNLRIIDYATNGHRSDFMDIYLGAKCTFFISSGTGIDGIPEIFRRPYMFVNVIPLERVHTWNANHLFIPKKHWLRGESRFMTFREILDSGAGRFLMGEQFEAMGIELIENSPEEIAALAIEMDERLRSTWITTDEDESLQRRFWSLYKLSELHGKIVSRIGAEFLRQHRDWLE